MISWRRGKLRITLRACWAPYFRERSGEYEHQGEGLPRVPCEWRVWLGPLIIDWTEFNRGSNHGGIKMKEAIKLNQSFKCAKCGAMVAETFPSHYEPPACYCECGNVWKPGKS